MQLVAGPPQVAVGTQGQPRPQQALLALSRGSVAVAGFDTLLENERQIPRQ